MARGKPKDKPFIFKWIHPTGKVFTNRFDTLKEAEKRIEQLKKIRSSN